MGNIPKVVYQTWKTKVLPERITEQRQRMLQENPDYEFRLFNDAEMDMWMHTNMDPEVVRAYQALRVGAAKADFWRYCILYKEGGVYLDIDSIIIKPIRDFIDDTDEAVISRETNIGCFLNWLLAFRAGHPILKRVIELVTVNIQERRSDSIVNITGPGVFTLALKGVLSEYIRYELGLWHLYDDDLNAECNIDIPARCKFIGIDFHDYSKGITYALWKMPHEQELYAGTKHWMEEPTIFKDGCG